MSTLQKTLISLTNNMSDEKIEIVIKFAEFLNFEDKEDTLLNELADEAKVSGEFIKLDDLHT